MAWYAACFTLPCDPDSLTADGCSPPPSELLPPFQRFLNALQPEWGPLLPSPTLPRLSLFLGRRSVFHCVLRALSLCSSPRRQVALLNDIPLQLSEIDAISDACPVGKYGQTAAFFHAMASMPSRGGLAVPPSASSAAAATSTTTTLCLSEAIALVALRAVQHNAPDLIEFLSGLEGSASTEAKKLIVDVVLRLPESEFSKARAWGAGASMLHEQCGESSLRALCELVLVKKDAPATSSLSDALHICGTVARLRDVSGVLRALNQRNALEAVDQLLEREQAGKSIDTILSEMSTPMPAAVKPHQFPFDHSVPPWCASATRRTSWRYARCIAP